MVGEYSQDGYWWWNGDQWVAVPVASTKHTVSLTVFVVTVVAIIIAFASGFVSIEQHVNLGGWTISVGGYSCWFSPNNDAHYSYCGSDSGVGHIPIPSSQN